MLLEKKGKIVWKKHSTKESFILWGVSTALIILAIYSFKLISENTFWAFFWDAPNQIATMIARMFPPKWNYITTLSKPIWDTVIIATLGTVLAIFFAVPIAFLAAKNTTPNKLLVKPFSTLIMVTSRSVNSLIWALMLVMIIGPGVLAGILAISLRSIGFISKLLYEAIEEIDEVQVEAIKSTGAGVWHILMFAIVPQITPAFVSISIYRWDINIRESAILGIVGAGGIGIYLSASINSLAWNQVSVILIVILLSVFIAEYITYSVRKLILKN